MTETKKPDSESPVAVNAEDHAGGGVTVTAPAAEAAAPRSYGWLAFFLFLIAAAAAAGSGYLYYELEQMRASRADNTAKLSALSEELAALGEVFVTRDEFNGSSEAQTEQLQQINNRLLVIEEAVAVLRNIAQGGRTAWLHAEVKYLLRLANDELHIARNRNTALRALRALRAADEILRELTDPALNPVRAQLRKEIAALQALPDPDVTGMALALAAISEQVYNLPLKRQAQDEFQPESAATAQDGETDRGIWSSAWTGVKDTFRSMVAIRRNETPTAPLLPPEQEYFLYQNLALRLESARLALLTRDAANYRTSLNAARNWLRTYFDTADPAVQSMLTDINGMLEVQLAPALPDISDSLEMLRSRYPDEDDS